MSLPVGPKKPLEPAVRYSRLRVQGGEVFVPFEVRPPRLTGWRVVDSLSVGYVPMFKRKLKPNQTIPELFVHMVPFLEKFAQGLRRSFGYADMAIEQTYEYLEKHYCWMVDKELTLRVPQNWFDVGVNMLKVHFGPFLKGNLRLLTLEESLAKQKGNASPCGCWTVQGFREKRELLQSPLFYDHMKDLLKRVNEEEAICFPSSINRKFEIRKRDIETGERKATRLFKGNSIEVVVLEDMFLHVADQLLGAVAKHKFNRVSGWLLGFVKFHGNWHRLGQILYSFLHQASFDVSKMDASTMMELLEFVLRFVNDYHTEPFAGKLLLFLLRNVVEYLSLLDDGLLLQMFGSNASGRRGTGFTNTLIVLLILAIYHWLRCKKNVFVDPDIYVGNAGDNFVVAHNYDEFYFDGLFIIFKMFNYTIECRGRGLDLEFNSCVFKKVVIGNSEYYVPAPVDPNKRLAVLLLASEQEQCANPDLYYQMACNIRLDGWWSPTVRLACDVVLKRLTLLVPPERRTGNHDAAFVNKLYLGNLLI